MKPSTNSTPRWTERLEARRGFLAGAVTLVCVAILLATALRNPVDYDGYWHLRMGMDWVRNGLSPWVDHYSFTFPGASISAIPYMFQVALYGMVELFGERGGMIALKLTLSLFIFGCMIAWLERIKAPILGYMLALLVAVIAIQARAQVRPELFSFGLMLISLMLYVRADLQLTVRAIAPIVALLIFWGNYHSPIFGYVIFFGLFIDIAIRLVREHCAWKEWLKWSGWGVVLVGAGYLRPNFIHPVFGTDRFMNEWGQMIQEYLPPIELLGSALGTLLMVIAALTLLGLLIQRKAGLFLVTLIFVYSAVTMSRMVAPATLLCAAMLPLIIRDWKSKTINPAFGAKTITAVAITAIGLGVSSLVMGILVTHAYLQENRTSWSKFPSRLANYYVSTGRTGNIFNDHDTGGYLIYRLSPDSKVYIDGRTNILYPLEHYKRYQIALNDPDTFLKEVERHDIQSAVLKANKDSASLMIAAGWTLDFMDAEFALFQPQNGHLENFGRVWGRPYCWAPDYRDELATELAFLSPATGRVVPATPMMHYVAAYARTNDAASFIREVAPDYDFDDSGRRILAILALEHGEFETAIKLTSEIETREPRDDLVPVYANGKLGNWQDAQSAMSNALSASWRTILLSEQVLQMDMLKWLSLHLPLQHSLEEHRSQLVSKLPESTIVKNDFTPEFCLEEKDSYTPTLSKISN